MKGNLLVLCLMVSLSLGLGGCLTLNSTYDKRDMEAKQFETERDNLTARYTALTKESEGLKSEVAMLKGDLSTLTMEKAKLAAEKDALSSDLKSSTSESQQRVGELRQKVSDLESENARLKQEKAELMKAKEEKVKEVSSTYEQLMEKMKSEISQGQVTISELKGKLTVNMEAAILFDSGKADVKQDGLAILLKLVPTLQGVSDKAIRIEGHTDNVPIKSSQFPSNWELSAARAINVTKYLQQQGIDPANLSAAAFAEYKPVADNSTKEGKAKNRRIEITLVAKDEPLLPASAQ